MNTNKLFVKNLENLRFEELPKCEVLKIGINAYNGNVFLSLSNRKQAGRIGLELMRSVVSICDYLESQGERDALDVLMAMDSEGVQALMDRVEGKEGRKRGLPLLGFVCRKRKAG